jgi:hypothetical protein
MSADCWIVLTDNFGMSGEVLGKDEKFLLWPMSHDSALQIVRILNDDCAPFGPDFLKVVDLDYKLKVFES